MITHAKISQIVNFIGKVETEKKLLFIYNKEIEGRNYYKCNGA